MGMIHSFTIPSYRGDYVLNHSDPGINQGWFGGNLEGRCLQTRDGLVVAGFKDFCKEFSTQKFGR